MSLLASRLLGQLRTQHLEADAALHTLIRTDVTREDYVAFLQRAYGFEAVLESALAATPNLDRAIDLSRRVKRERLASDLRALGTGAHELTRLPRCAVPQFRDKVDALGWMYVVERSTLMHDTLRHHLMSRLPHLATTATSYLSCYAGEVGGCWARFMAALDRTCTGESTYLRLEHATRAAFETRRRWMRGAPMRGEADTRRLAG